MIHKAQELFDGLPPKVKVFLVGIGGAAGTAVVDALYEGLHALLTGQAPPTRASFAHLLSVSLFAGLFAARKYAQESPIPRRIWTWQEREAERIAAEKREK